MDQDLQITGDNPFYISFRDSRLDGDPILAPTESEQRVVFRWIIKRHPCLGIEVVPVADTVLELNVRHIPGESDAPGNPIELRRVPQTLKVTLSCKDCDCGKQSATIKYHMSTRGNESASYGLHETSLSIICIGPECDEDEVIIRRVSYDSPEHLYDISLPEDSPKI